MHDLVLIVFCLPPHIFVRYWNKIVKFVHFSLPTHKLPLFYWKLSVKVKANREGTLCLILSSIVPILLTHYHWIIFSFYRFNLILKDTIYDLAITKLPSFEFGTNVQKHLGQLARVFLFTLLLYLRLFFILITEEFMAWKVRTNVRLVYFL